MSNKTVLFIHKKDIQKTVQRYAIPIEVGFICNRTHSFMCANIISEALVQHTLIKEYDSPGARTQHLQGELASSYGQPC